MAKPLKTRSWGERTPELEQLKTSDELNDLDPEGDEYAQKIKQVVAWEKKRLWKKQKHSKQPETELGKRISETHWSSHRSGGSLGGGVGREDSGGVRA